MTTKTKIEINQHPEVQIIFSNMKINYNPAAADIVDSLKGHLKELPNVQEAHTRLLLKVIANQAKEIERFENKTSTADHVHTSYTNIKKELTKVMKKPVDITSLTDIKNHYFELRETTKKSIQVIKQVENRRSLRPGSAAPTENIYELIE